MSETWTGVHNRQDIPWWQTAAGERARGDQDRVI